MDSTQLKNQLVYQKNSHKGLLIPITILANAFNSNKLVVFGVREASRKPKLKVIKNLKNCLITLSQYQTSKITKTKNRLSNRLCSTNNNQVIIK